MIGSSSVASIYDWVYGLIYLSIFKLLERSLNDSC